VAIASFHEVLRCEGKLPAAEPRETISEPSPGSPDRA
jgi:hypothetical protein